jgi:hypothetical protein
MKTSQLMAYVGAFMSSMPFKKTSVSENGNNRTIPSPNFEDVNLWIILGILPSKKSFNLSPMVFPGTSYEKNQEPQMGLLFEKTSWTNPSGEEEFFFRTNESDGNGMGFDFRNGK